MNNGDVSQDTSEITEKCQLKWQSRKVEGIIEISITGLTANILFFFSVSILQAN